MCRRLNVPVPSEFMPAPRLLVMEGNSPETRAQHVAAGGTVASKGYSELLSELLPDAIVDVCFPGDPGANLPTGEALEGYDGVAITGSGLHVYDDTPQVTRQIDLARAVLKAGTPAFGSCWGLQVLTVAAGGVVRKNPKGREIGFGRRIKLTEPGRKHPMYVGKPEVFNAPTVHLDEVETIAPGHHRARHQRGVRRPERGNPLQRRGGLGRAVSSRISAARDRRHRPADRAPPDRRRIFPRHPRRSRLSPTTSSTLDRDPAEKRLAWRYGISKNVLDKKLRTGEVANWLQYQVLPTRAKRGRG